MKGLNVAYLIGNIGQDPELRHTAVGLAIVKLSVATPNARKEGDAWVETPDWHRLTFFEKTAEYIARYAHKGDMIAVEAAIRPSKWTDRENKTHYEVNLVVGRVLWLQAKRARAGEETGTSKAEPSGAPMAPPPSDEDRPDADPDDGSDDGLPSIPF